MSKVGMDRATVDVLRQAQRDVLDPAKRFEFTDWAHCNCGRIFTAATGAVSEDGAGGHRETMYPAYSRVIRETAAALGASDAATANADKASSYVSMATFAETSSRLIHDGHGGPITGSLVTRADAAKVLGRAIRQLEATKAPRRVPVRPSEPLVQDLETREGAIA